MCNMFIVTFRSYPTQEPLFMYIVYLHLFKLSKKIYFYIDITNKKYKIIGLEVFDIDNNPIIIIN